MSPNNSWNPPVSLADAKGHYLFDVVVSRWTSKRHLFDVAVRRKTSKHTRASRSPLSSGAFLMFFFFISSAASVGGCAARRQNANLICTLEREILAELLAVAGRQFGSSTRFMFR